MASTSPEDWWCLDAVQQLLANLLEHPANDHSEAVGAALREYNGVLLDAHVANRTETNRQMIEFHFLICRSISTGR